MDDFSISILSEETVSNSIQAREKGGIWLQVGHKDKQYLSYLAPDNLISWIEGAPINKYALFVELDEKQNKLAFKLFEQALRKLFKSGH